MRVVAAVVLLLSSACIELSLPEPPPPPGPGTIQGTAVYAVAGRTGYRPAGGARVTLLSTGTGTVAAADSGRFTLSNVRVTTGALLFTVDLDGDGVVDRQRALDLATIGAGPGKNVALGDVVLSQNATVAGRVLRADNPLPTGHGGIAVFVPGAPYATATADTGDFVLENLPEGSVRLAFFLQGFGAESRDVAARGGEESRVSTTTLKPSTEASTPAAVTGVVRLDDKPLANARLRFVSPTSSFIVTTDANGAFSTTTMNATLYQVAIEADGATSLRLYNVLLLPGMNDLGTLQLTAGESTPLSIDAGVLTPFDAGVVSDGGVAGTTAVIEPAVLELAPGASGQLSSGRSTGPRPLVAHWRNAGDGGLGVTFATPDTSASFVQVFAPDASGLFPISLRVTDVAGVDSPEARAVVRVGRRPSVSMSVDGGSAVVAGALVELEAVGTSSDQPIAAYRWTQRTGPAITIGANDGPRLSFTAPQVVGPTPLTIDVVALTTLGFESPPASMTLVVGPGAAPMLVATASQPIVLFDGGSTVVTLTASVMGGASDAGWVFSWSPLRGGCPLPDGGLDSTCPEGWVLSNVTGSTAQFQAPFVSGDKTFPFTVTATPAGGTPVLSAQVSVDVLDRVPPSCRSSPVSPLSVLVQCNEPMLVNVLTGLDAGVAASSRVVSDGGLLTFYFDSVLPAVPLQFGATGLVDRSGNSPPPFPIQGTPRLSLSPTYASSGSTSTTNPRAAWMRLTNPMDGSSPFAIVARATSSSARKVWVLTPTTACGTAPCLLTPSVFQDIPFYGPLTGSTASVAVEGRAYVITSRGNPSSLVEYANGQWREVSVMETPDLFSLGTDGKQVFVFSVDGGSLERRLFDGGTFGPAELVTPIPNGVQSVEFAATPSRRPFVFTTSAGTGSVFEQVPAPLWNPPMVSLSLDTQNVDLKAVMFGEDLHDAFVFRRISDGFVEAKAWNRFTMQTMTSGGVPTQEYDVAPFGNGALLAWSDSGAIHLALVTRGAATIDLTDVALEDGGLSFSNGGQGSFPRLTVEGAEVRLAWQEEAFAGSGFQVFGLVIR